MSPWCSVKTQFGPVEGHVALVELLAALKKQFISNLQVQDEGGYWDGRDVNALTERFRSLQAAIDGLAGGLRQFRLTGEAAEDPQILIARIERIARQVHQTISRPVEHPPVQFEGADDALWAGEPVGTEAEWDAVFKDNRRKQERMQRAIEERIHRGETHAQAFDHAMHDAGILNLPDEIAEPAPDVEGNELLDDDNDWPDDDESWLDDEPLGQGDDSITPSDDEFSDRDQVNGSNSPAEGEDDEDPFDSRPRDPLLERAMDLLLRLDKFGKEIPTESENHFAVLQRGCGEMMGGLAQATGPSDYLETGLRIVQLKRALRGAAFARGALFPLRSAGVFSSDTFEQLYKEIEDMASAMTTEMARLRESLESGESPEV